MRCGSCEAEAKALCRWQTDSLLQEAPLCQEHIDDLWARLNPLLQANRASFTILPASPPAGGVETHDEDPRR